MILKREHKCVKQRKWLCPAKHDRIKREIKVISIEVIIRQGKKNATKKNSSISNMIEL